MLAMFTCCTSTHQPLKQLQCQLINGFKVNLTILALGLSQQ